MMAMCVSDVPPPRPYCAASIPCPFRLSRLSGATLPPPAPPLAEGKVDGPLFSAEEFRAVMFAKYGLRGPLFSDEEFRALMLEYETQAPLFSPDEYLAGMPAEGETQAPPPPQAPAPLLPVVGPCADNQEHSKKRKAPEGRLEGPRRSKRAKRKPPSRRTQNKMVATRILNRRFRAPEPSRRRTVLWCQCQELPRETPGCALHQVAPDRSWMTEQGHIPSVGGVGEVLVPKLSAHDRRELVNRYRRWRSRVWMPSRFYVECAQEKRALQDDCLMLAV